MSVPLPAEPNLSHLPAQVQRALHSKIHTAQLACSTILRHKQPHGFAEAVIEHQLAEDEEDYAKASELEQAYQLKYEPYLSPQGGGEQAEVALQTAVSNFLIVKQDVVDLRADATRRKLLAHPAQRPEIDVEEKACATVITYLTALFSSVRQALLTASASHSRTNPTRRARAGELRRPRRVSPVLEDREEEALGKGAGREGAYRRGMLYWGRGY